jgi:radical SAM protein with 4Fe4S-binding SPASM domain
MCHQNERRIIEKGEMTTLEAFHVINRLSEAKVESIHILGGEIFLRRDLFEIFHYLEKKRIYFDLVTNGTLIDKTVAERLRYFKYLTGIDYSVDGLREANDFIRSEGVFDKVVEAINLTREDRQFAITITCVLNNRTASQFEEFIDFFARQGVDGITFILEMFSTQEELNASTGFVRRGDTSEEFFLNLGSKDRMISPDILRKLTKLSVIKTKKTGVLIDIIPPVAKKNPEAFLDGKLRQEGNVLMCGALSKIIIDQYGNVRGCPFININFGNLTERPLEEIWNSESFQNFRRDLLRSNLLDICLRCCNLQIAET